MKKVNERRTSREWSKYISSKKAIEIIRNDKKKVFKNNLTLVKFFDVGINEEGYWKYNQIALQVEDIYDVLEAKFNNNNNLGDVEFLLMMDQSSGH